MRHELLQSITKIEDKLAVAKILDRAEKSEKYNCMTYSDFLDPHLTTLVRKALSKNMVPNYYFTGGYSGAERNIIVFCPVNMSTTEDTTTLGILKVLNIRHKTRPNLTHRDYLGALMGLGIKREKVGDILVKEESCDIIVLTDIAQYIELQLTKVKNTKVEVTIGEAGEIEQSEPNVKNLKASVASLRLDCIASAGYGLSRSKISEYIKSGKVSLNWEVTDSITKQVKEGDTISIRGKGRVVLHSVGHSTKKGRISITLLKYI